MATKRQAARINDENGFFDGPAEASPRPRGEGPGVRAALVRMERDAKYGPPLTADVHPSEVERRQARGWRRA